MPRDPKDVSVSGSERRNRRMAEALDIKEPALLRPGGGAAGPEGKAGEDGATWLSGTTVPSTELGAVGDFYFRTTTSDVYKKTGEAIWSFQVNIKGETGSTGTNGSTWYSGEGEPAGGTGVNGDYYFRTSNGFVYKKEGGVWSKVAELKGESGKEGPAGAATMNGFKEPVKAAATGNIAIATALNPGDTLDGVALAENDRVLVPKQTTKKENGIWIVKAVPVRATDADAAGELRGGTTVYVEQGTQAGRTYVIATAGSITPGTTEHVWRVLAPRKVAYGRVSAAGAAESGEGFTVSKVGTGLYKVTFAEEAPIIPTVVANPITSSIVPFYAPRNVTKTSFEFQVWGTTGGAGSDQPWSFTAEC